MGFPMPAWPPKPKQQFTDDGDCGKGVTDHITGRVVSSGTTRVPAGTFATVEIVWTQNITIQGTRLTITTRDLLAPALRLPVESWRLYKAEGVSFALHTQLVTQH